MNDRINKDFVVVATHVCPVCGVQEESNEILIHRRFGTIPENKRCTGYGLCEVHQEQVNEGYIFLVECSNTDTSTNTLTFDNAIRTGAFAAIKKPIFKAIFGENENLYNFCEIGVLNNLEKIKQEALSE